MQLTCASCFDDPRRRIQMENELEQARVKHEELEKELEQARVKQEELEKELEQARVKQAELEKEEEQARLKLQRFVKEDRVKQARIRQGVQNRLDLQEELASVKKATVQHVSFIAAGAFQRLLEDAPVVTPEVVAPVEAVDQPVDSAAASAAAPVDSASAPATPPFKAPPVKAPPARHAKAAPPEVGSSRWQKMQEKTCCAKAPPPLLQEMRANASVGSAEAPAMPPVAVQTGVDATDPWEDGNPAAMNAPSTRTASPTRADVGAILAKSASGMWRQCAFAETSA